MRNPFRPIPLISLVALAALLMPAMPSRASSEAVITVNTTADELINDGDCSLREAIYAANNNSNLYGCTAGSGDDTIILPAGTYQLSIPGVDENNAMSGDLDILGNLIIQGAGRELTLIDGGYLDTQTYIDRVFHIFTGVSVEISQLTIQNGFAAFGSFGGGGILNEGTLSLQDISMQNNHAMVVGGGMDNYRGTATITNSFISGNTSTEDGGGIFNDGYLTLTSSTLSGNMAANGGGGLDNRDNAMLEKVTISGNTALTGGGVFSDGPLLFSDSTLSGNMATTGKGGGLYNWGSSTLVNVTISGNTASEEGGGLFNLGSGTLVNATISGNTASEGGGLFNQGDLVLRYTTIVANTATAALVDKGGNIQNANSIRMKTSVVVESLVGPNCNGSPIVSLGHNLEDEDTCNFHGVGDLKNQTAHGIDSLLTDNGGPTLTHALDQDSPAIDGGDDDECPTKDQRGAFRPADGNGNGDATCDIGAFEYMGVFSKYVYVPLVAR